MKVNIMKRSLFFIAAVAAAAVTGAVVAWGVSSRSQGADAIIAEHNSDKPFASGAGAHFTAYEPQEYPDLTYAAENAVKAVVNIEKTEKVEYSDRSADPFFEFFFGVPRGYSEPQERRYGGSGVIISEDGYIVTNNHVVENASTLKVTLNDNRVFDAKIVGTDPTTDVALIKIDGKDLPTIPFGSSDDLRLGEWVLAIGSPFDLRSTITAGIVSAKARNLNVIPNEFSLESFIQTDAAVNMGNSGGALVNTRGELVGINTVIKSSTGNYIGYSFAVPESIVKKVVVDLKEYGVVQRAMLGISYRPVDQAFIDEMGDETGIKEIGGAYVASVDPSGAASAAGIRKGDVITAINGVKIKNGAALQEQISRYRPGDKIKVTLQRNGKEIEKSLTLKNSQGNTEMKKAVDFGSLGTSFKDLTRQQMQEMNIRSGVQVVGLKNGKFKDAGIREGFVILEVNGQNIRSVSDMETIFDSIVRSNQPRKVMFITGIYPTGKIMYYAVDLSE